MPEPTPNPESPSSASPPPAPASPPPPAAPPNGGDPGPKQEPATDWRASVTDPALIEHARRFNSVTDLVKGHADLRKQLSTAIVPPKKDAKPEEVAEYRKRIGVPDTPEGYKFAMPEGREITDADKAAQGRWAAAFHKANITAEQAAELNATWSALIAEGEAAQAAADKENADRETAALKAEWGGDFEQNTIFAKRAARRLFGDDFDKAAKIETKDGRFLLDNAIFARMFARLGREMGEDRLGSAMTDVQRASAQEQIDALDKEYFTAMDRGDRIAAKRIDAKRQAAYDKLYGGEPVIGNQGRTL